ncbi:Nramp family divalent metal transporter [Natrialba asiatica]|uniref:NRAMP family Mn2+/Fe2+ transporter n=1 Tax=Natrialba asiatica (strain ATCC 700177 / DSM 12278 / JCM 9576 / FERM P-10747 / NBRC 102637 / 172P1) TaxID=29540 RepID=M0AX78_NATA1|nr:Nramp family divalent metal transporter [Natrialba asiatica]ELZ02573.1 NRAMP family Mn2+/Fe2+ transporter [Natrialba asiatica DSM 12278]
MGTNTGSETDIEAADLSYPASSWRGFFTNHFGPSMLWALISIGGSHIVLAPTLGGTFGLFAIWMFALIYLAKYGGWELGIRYNYGAGGNPVEAYDQLPGPKNWMQWFTVGVFTIIYTGITAAVGMSTAAFVEALTPLSFQQAFVVFVGLAGVLVLITRYSLLEKILIGFTVALGVLIVLGVLVGPPSGEVVTATTFTAPDLTGPLFIGLFAAAAGFAPTGFSTSVLIGSWSTAKGEGASELRAHNLDPNDDQYHDYIRAWIRTGRRDFNIGYAFSFTLIVAMVILASNVLYPTPPEDANLAVTIGSILSDSFGEWSYYAMVLGAFAALYSTVITLLDGAARATGDVLPMALDQPELDSERIRKLVVVGIVAVSCGVVVTLGTVPVTFLIWISAILAVTEILFYPANWYVVRENLPEQFQPSRAWVAYYAVSLVVVLAFGIMGAASEFGYV